MSWIFYGLILAVIFSAAFYQVPRLVWVGSLAAILIIFSLFGQLSIFAVLITWLVWIALAGFIFWTAGRRQYIIQPLLAGFKRKLPTISATEREALEAGDTWWEQDLFCGRFNFRKLLALPKLGLTAAETDFLHNQVETLCGLLNDWEMVFRQHDLPSPAWDYLRQEKFFGLIIPKRYGGLEFSALAHSAIVAKIASKSISAAVTTMVPNSLGPAELLLHYGNEEQREYYLPRLAAGIEIPCFALTAPEAGSDASAIPDSGIIGFGMHADKKVLGIKLSWDKRYITLAPVATLLGVAFHLSDPDHLLGDNTYLGITLALIPTAHPGVEIGTRHFPMYTALMNGPTRGRDVFIPLDWIIGGAENAGRGWAMLMECLSIGRSISLPALATASSKLAYGVTGAYARVRRQFNQPLVAFGGVEEALGYIAGYCYIVEASRIMTASAVAQGVNPAIVSAIAKYQMTELGRIILSHAMDVHGGHMLQLGPRNLLANAYLAMPISITVEGANILTRNLIIFGQGAIRCHPYILREIELINQQNSAELDQVLLRHIGFYLANLLRSFGYGITAGRLIFAREFKHAAVRKSSRQLIRMSTALAVLADTSLILLGGRLKREERISARLGDILSNLYLASAVLKYFYDHGQHDDEVTYVSWALQMCLLRIQTACDELLANYTYRWVGKLLRGIIFPWGRSYTMVDDKLHAKLAHSMNKPGGVRDRLLQHVYTGHDENLHKRLEHALVELPSIDIMRTKLNQAIKSGRLAAELNFADLLKNAETQQILDAAEVQRFKVYEELYAEIIKVNEFSFQLNEVLA